MTNAVMEAAYFQTYFLAQAIEKVKSTDADALIFEGLPGQEFQAPQGKVKIDEKNHHTWLWAAHRQGQRAGPVRHGLEVGGLDPAGPVGDLPLSEQGLRLHRQARARSREEALERGRRTARARLTCNPAAAQQPFSAGAPDEGAPAIVDDATDGERRSVGRRSAMTPSRSSPSFSAASASSRSWSSQPWVWPSSSASPA